MKIDKLLKALLLKEEDSERMDLPPKTFEDDPMNFILKKYDTLHDILVEIMGENYKEYLLGVYVIADKPSCFKIVLHNNQYFFMTFMGEAYQATIAGKNYFLLEVGQKQRAMIAITRLLRWGSPLKTKGAEGAEQDGTAEDMPTDETGSEEAGGGAEESGGGGEEEETLAEIKNVLGILINENKLAELARNAYDILSDDAKEIAKDLLTRIPKIKKSQIQPETKNNIVIYNDDRENIVSDIENLEIYGKRIDRSGNFRIKTKSGQKISIIVKRDKTSGEYYELKAQSLGVPLNVFIPIKTLRSQLKTGIENHAKLDRKQKQCLLGMMGFAKPSQKVIDDCLQNKKFVAEINKNFGEPLGSILYAEKINGKEVFFPAAKNYPLIDYRVKKANNRIVDVSAKAEGIKGNVVKFGDVLQKIRDKNIEDQMTKDQKIIFDTVLSSQEGKKENVAIKILKLADKFGEPDTKKRYEQFLKDNPGFLDSSKKDLEKWPKYGYDSRTMASIQKDICRDINNDSKLDFSKLFQQAVGLIYVKFEFNKQTLEPNVNPYDSKDISVYIESKASFDHVGENIGFQIKTG
jgi:hypothetical protein